MQLTLPTFVFVSSIPGKFAIERYPALKYVPSALLPSKAEVLKQRQKDIDLYTELMDEVCDKVDKGIAQPCFATHLLEEREKLGMSNLEIAYTAGSPFGAGVDTVRFTISTSDVYLALTTTTRNLSLRDLWHASFLHVPNLVRRSSQRHSKSLIGWLETAASLHSKTYPSLSTSMLSHRKLCGGDLWLF